MKGITWTDDELISRFMDDTIPICFSRQLMNPEYKNGR